MQTSRDKIYWERDAAYAYYKHGALATTTLGQMNVQKQDFVYTLQGWIKAVNPDNTVSGMVAKNVYNYVLDYYNNDYTGIGASSPSANIPSQLGSDNKQLFNGNISAMGINIPKLGNSILYNYQYDQLNRLVNMDAWTSTDNAWNGLSIGTNFKERFNYNPDGGILTMYRNGYNHTIDNYAAWNYYSGTHRLEHINDPAGNFGFDAGAQNANNYTWNAIGQMTGDAERGITNIGWTVYGKVKSQTINGTNIYYTYDAANNRITKKVADTMEVYVRDGSGNVLSIYKKKASAAIAQTEINLYGSSRIGHVVEQSVAPTTITLSGGFGTATFSTFTRVEKFFEFTEQRGNVAVTVSDKKIQVSDGNGGIAYYNADVITAQDYSSFGALLENRQYGNTPRYTYNGKQLDKETGWQEYGMREYMGGEVPIFTSVDPLTAKYAGWSPYPFAMNRVIDGVDLDGAEYLRKDDANISCSEQNTNGNYKITVGGQEIQDANLVTFNNQQYYQTCKDLYCIPTGISTSGTSSQLITQMFIRQEELNDIFPSGRRLDEVATLLNSNLFEYGIKTPEALSRFLGQVGAETSGLSKNPLGKTEGMNYTTAERIVEVWPSHFSLQPTKDKALAKDYLRNPEKLGNYIYGTIKGDELGNTSPGDGYLFRGRGILQLTGRETYTNFQTFYNRRYGAALTITTDPSPVASDFNVSIISALWEFREKVQTYRIDLQSVSIRQLTKYINGGKNGLDERTNYYKTSIGVLR